VVQKIVRELNGFDNVYYEICNEPWMGNVQMTWQYEIISTIVQTEAVLPLRHLVSLNAMSLRITNAHPSVSIYNFHRADMANVVAKNYGLNRVIGDNETGFRGRENLAYRTEAWDCILSGGALFSSLDYSFTARHPDGSFREYKSPGGGNRQFRIEMSVLREFINRFDLVRMAPDPAVVEGPLPEGLVPARVLADAGRAYAVYLRQRTDADKTSKDPRGPAKGPGQPFSITVVLPAGAYRAEWSNPVNGNTVHRGRFRHDGGERALTVPAFAEDIALRIQNTQKE
jgi:hypothetical protein